jgi:hypothetical protein
MNMREPQTDLTNQTKADFDPERRWALKYLLGMGGLAVAAGTGAYAAEPAARGGRVSVRDYGAAGDGAKPTPARFKRRLTRARPPPEAWCISLQAVT